MVQSAMAQETVCALRREIARLEGRLPAPPSEAKLPATPQQVPGKLSFEAALGGLPEAGLVEVTTAGERDAGAVAGFALALAALCLKLPVRTALAPILWIGTAHGFAERGLPYPAGFSSLLGVPAASLLLARAPRAIDALWIAEEAATAAGLGAILLDAETGKAAPDLLATQRLHRRAQAAGRVLVLLRYGGKEEPTAAPWRLGIASAPARPRTALGQPVPGTLGGPAFTVTVSKSRAARPATFILDWNADEQRFTERAAPHPGAVVSPLRHGPDPAPAAGAVVALKPGSTAAGGEPQGEQPPDPLRARRAG